MNKSLHIGTIHRKAERFLNDYHFESYLKEVLRLNVSYENTKHNLLFFFNQGQLIVKSFGDMDQRSQLVQLLKDKLNDINESNEPIVHDEFFYSVFASEQDEKGIAITDFDLHYNLIYQFVKLSTKEKEHNWVIYFTQTDNIDENNMYVIRSICVANAIHGNSW